MKLIMQQLKNNKKLGRYMRVIREIENKILELLAGLPLENNHHMLSYMLQIMGFATEIMCRSYEANT